MYKTLNTFLLSFKTYYCTDYITVINNDENLVSIVKSLKFTKNINIIILLFFN